MAEGTAIERASVELKAARAVLRKARDSQPEGERALVREATRHLLESVEAVLDAVRELEHRLEHLDS